MEIIPAIIPKSFADLEDKLGSLAKRASLAQIDVLDGSLTSPSAWPYQSASKPDRTFEAIVKEDKGFPFWQDIEFEAHFMVRGPERLAADWISAGASRIIVQIEGTQHLGKVIEAVSGRVPIGVSLAVDTPSDAIKTFASDVEVIQCMGWKFSHLGKQGEPLDPAVFEKIRGLRRDFPEVIISVDGGVTLENFRDLAAAGAERFVVGSAIWESGNPREALAKFQESQES